MGSKLPNLISVRQAAELTGLTKHQLWYALKRGHISSSQCQKVDGYWVLTEDFVIRDSAVRNDPFLASLPTVFTGVEEDKDFEAKTEKKARKSNIPYGHSRVVRLPGFERETAELTGNDIYLMCKVHPSTQKRIREGKTVRASVALRLAKGLGIDVERLLR